tara:strand:+ start:679 stop:1737 length:1059 start_codon:yes stop_codon:yes gene_type:complete
MASSYDNDLRLEEMGTGEQIGSWGTTTNTNLSLIAEAFSYQTEATFDANANKEVTIQNGQSDKRRAFYLKVTSSATLDATKTLTILPNTVSKVIFIENATSGGQSITISQGSGASVTIANGKTKGCILDGGGSGAVVYDLFEKIDLGASATFNGGTFVTASSTDTFTNKTIDADGTGNSITNIEDANIKSSAAIDAAKIANGTVSNTEFQYLNGVTSAIQTQLNTKGTSSFSGSYTDLSNKPTIPTNNNQLSNGAGYLTSSTLASSYSSTSLSGYIRFANGFQMCWARITSTFAGTWTFPLSFPNACVGVSKHDELSSSTGNGENYVYNISTSSVSFVSGSTGYKTLIAVGY